MSDRSEGATISAMEATLKCKPTNAGITKGTVSVLEELILSSTIFYSLHEEDFEKLLPQLRVEQQRCCCDCGTPAVISVMR